MPNPFLEAKGWKTRVTEITSRDKVKVTFFCLVDHLISSDPDDPKNFLVEKKPEVAEEIPLNAYIQQFDHEVDLKEKLNRLRSKSEFDEFIGHTGLPQNGAVYEQKPYMSDLEIDAVIKAGKEAWASLPEELKKDYSQEEFLASFNAKVYEKYVENLVAQQEKAKQAQAQTQEGGAQ
jgi:hypothetical protein